MNPVVHFELPPEDKAPMGKFYAQAFGWKIWMLGPDMGDYVLVTTVESDESGHPKEPGTINGGFTQAARSWAIRWRSRGMANTFRSSTPKETVSA